jgi:regulator of sigma E protease
MAPAAAASIVNPMTVAFYVLGILGLALLMIVHEGGHFLAARHYGMRVVRFSIGFGPTLWKHRPANSPTTYQLAIIPFLAYVQIAGMNPYEESDPKDPGSYANASLWARIVTIAAGPLTNYLFASVLLFAGLMTGGKEVSDEASMRVFVDDSGAAAQAGIRDEDRIVSVDGEAVRNWDDLKRLIGSHAGETIDVVIERDGREEHKAVTPAAKGTENEGKILVGPATRTEKVGVLEAAKLSVIQPPVVVYETVLAIGEALKTLVTRKGHVHVSGPGGIVKEAANQARRGPDKLLKFLGALSAYLGAFNLLPFPALDGGRLIFLGIEAASRRRADAKLEARVHALGLLVLLGLIAIVTYFDFAPKR